MRIEQLGSVRPHLRRGRKWKRDGGGEKIEAHERGRATAPNLGTLRESFVLLFSAWSIQDTNVIFLLPSFVYNGILCRSRNVHAHKLAAAEKMIFA